MAKVVVRFFDDETVEGVARDLDFDEPDFLVEVDDAGGLENNETAWIPLTAGKGGGLPRGPHLASQTPNPQGRDRLPGRGGPAGRPRGPPPRATHAGVPPLDW